MKVDYEEIAADILFTGKLDFAKHGVEYRKGKTVDDVKHAHEKAIKAGMCKVEIEIDMFATYLKSVLKARKEK